MFKLIICRCGSEMKKRFDVCKRRTFKVVCYNCEKEYYSEPNEPEQDFYSRVRASIAKDLEGHENLITDWNFRLMKRFEQVN